MPRSRNPKLVTVSSFRYVHTAGIQSFLAENRGWVVAFKVPHLDLHCVCEEWKAAWLAEHKWPAISTWSRDALGVPVMPTDTRIGMVSSMLPTNTSLLTLRHPTEVDRVGVLQWLALVQMTGIVSRLQVFMSDKQVDPTCAGCCCPAALRSLCKYADVAPRPLAVPNLCEHGRLLNHAELCMRLAVIQQRWSGQCSAPMRAWLDEAVQSWWDSWLRSSAALVGEFERFCLRVQLGKRFSVLVAEALLAGDRAAAVTQFVSSLESMSFSPRKYRDGRPKLAKAEKRARQAGQRFDPECSRPECLGLREQFLGGGSKRRRV